MFSLAAFAIIGVFVLVVWFSAWLCRKIAIAVGAGRVAARIAAIFGASIVLAPVFWDVPPTLIAHRYYCTRDAGVWVYKKPQQWYAESKGAKKIAPALIDNTENSIRISWGILQERTFDKNIFLSVQIHRSRVVDVTNGEVLLEKKWYSAWDDLNNYKHLIFNINYCPMPYGDLSEYDTSIEELKKIGP